MPDHHAGPASDTVTVEHCPDGTLNLFKLRDVGWSQIVSLTRMEAWDAVVQLTEALTTSDSIDREWAAFEHLWEHGQVAVRAQPGPRHAAPARGLRNVVSECTRTTLDRWTLYTRRRQGRGSSPRPAPSGRTP